MYYVKNPIIEMTENTTTYSQDNFRLTGNLEFQILPELKLLTQYTYQRRKGEESSYASSNTQEGSGYWGDQKGVGRWAYSAGQTMEFEGRLTYNKTFNEKHSLNALGAIVYNKDRQNNTYFKLRDFPDDEVQNGIWQGSDLVDYGGKGGSAVGSVMFSYIARAEYKFMNRYLLTGTFRADGSSKFQKKNKWGYFPSAAVAWDVAKENFMSKQNIALITGVTGQDGSYLAELLLDKGYDVHGVIRRSSVDYRERIAHLEGRPHFHLHYADLGDSMSIVGVVADVRPTEIYNLAAQSHVQVSFDSPEFTADVDALGVLRIIEAVRKVGLANSCKIYQASTSELYGKVEEVPQNENTPFHPFSPYAVAKQYGFWIIKEYRDAYGMFCCNGILFNHESERRGETFVTRKITLAAARIAQGLQDKLYLGNLDSLRDWGYAKDYVECMWLILQARQPEDYVIATGVQHSVREFAQLAFHYVGIELQWEGEAEHEKGICVSGPDHLVGKTLVEVSPDFYRPTDVVNLWGDPTKARAKLGWNPNTTTFEELVKIMVDHDMAKVASEGAAAKVRMNLAEYLEKGIVK